MIRCCWPGGRSGQPGPAANRVKGTRLGQSFFFFFCSLSPWTVLGVAEGTCGSHPCAAKGQGSGEWHGWPFFRGKEGLQPVFLPPHRADQLMGNQRVWVLEPGDRLRARARAGPPAEGPPSSQGPAPPAAGISIPGAGERAQKAWKENNFSKQECEPGLGEAAGWTDGHPGRLQSPPKPGPDGRGLSVSPAHQRFWKPANTGLTRASWSPMPGSPAKGSQGSEEQGGVQRTAVYGTVIRGTLEDGQKWPTQEAPEWLSRLHISLQPRS